jgi:hypothetical protein
MEIQDGSMHADGNTNSETSIGIIAKEQGLNSLKSQIVAHLKRLQTPRTLKAVLVCTK